MFFLPAFWRRRPCIRARVFKEANDRRRGFELRIIVTCVQVPRHGPHMASALPFQTSRATHANNGLSWLRLHSGSLLASQTSKVPAPRSKFCPPLQRNVCRNSSVLRSATIAGQPPRVRSSHKMIDRDFLHFPFVLLGCWISVPFTDFVCSNPFVSFCDKHQSPVSQRGCAWLEHASRNNQWNRQASFRSVVFLHLKTSKARYYDATIQLNVCTI